MKTIKFEITKLVLATLLEAGYPLAEAAEAIQGPIKVSIDLIELEDDNGILIDRIYGYQER